MSVPVEEIATGVRRVPHLRLLVLYGSRARGSAHPRSDWDFAYLGGAGFDPDALLALLVDLTRHERIDAVDLDRAGALIRHRIARDGLLLFEAESGLFERFRLAAIHAWCDLEPVLTPLYERTLEGLVTDDR